MTQGEGLVGLLYAVKALIQDSAIFLISGVAVVAFFWMAVRFIGNKFGMFTGGGIGLGAKGKIEPKQIMYGLFILFVILSVYSLIALTADVFGVNSSPSGGLLVR